VILQDEVKEGLPAHRFVVDVAEDDRIDEVKDQEEDQESEEPGQV